MYITAKFILSCFYFFLPAYFTNMTPSLSAQVGVFNTLDKPIDSGRHINGRRFLGDHKTWRGPLLGAPVGFLLVFLQKWLFLNFPSFREISLLNYQSINIWLFAFLITTGTIGGDLAFSFIKRRLDLKPGAKFVPFDQINYVIGSAVFLTPFFEIGIFVWLTILVLTFLLHIGATQVGFLLGLSRSKW